MSEPGVGTPPRLRTGARLPLPWLLLGIASAGVAAAWLYRFDPAAGGPYPACYFHRITGLLCPGCGGLRATHQLLHGHWGAAYHFNPLFVASLPVAALAIVRLGWLRWRGRGVSLEPKPSWIWCGGAIVLVFGILRNLPGSHGAWLGLQP